MPSLLKMAVLVRKIFFSTSNICDRQLLSRKGVFEFKGLEILAHNQLASLIQACNKMTWEYTEEQNHSWNPKRKEVEVTNVPPSYCLPFSQWSDSSLLPHPFQVLSPLCDTKLGRSLHFMSLGSTLKSQPTAYGNIGFNKIPFFLYSSKYQ